MDEKELPLVFNLSCLILILIDRLLEVLRNVSAVFSHISYKCGHFDLLKFHGQPLRCLFYEHLRIDIFACQWRCYLWHHLINVPSHTTYNVLQNRSRGCGKVLWGRWLLEKHNGLPTMYRFPGWQISPQGRHEYHCAGTYPLNLSLH